MPFHRTRIAAAATAIIAAAFAAVLPAGAQEAKPRYTAEDISKAKPSGRIEVEVTLGLAGVQVTLAK